MAKKETKKKINKKAPSKKQTKVVRKVTKKEEKTPKKDKSTLILLTIFLILCVIVFILAIVMVVENANSKNGNYNISIPITKEELDKGINIEIDMSNVDKNESLEYRIQTTNYKDDEINKEELTYQMTVTLPDDSDIDVELYSSKENYELLQGKTKVTDQVLTKDKKEEITYTFKLTQNDNPSEKETVKVEFQNEE